jgi:cytochrome c5
MPGKIQRSRRSFRGLLFCRFHRYSTRFYPTTGARGYSVIPHVSLYCRRSRIFFHRFSASYRVQRRIVRYSILQFLQFGTRDPHFFAIVLFAVARTVGLNTQRQYVLLDPLHTKQVHENIAPFAKEAVAGQDNSALAAMTAPKAEAADVPATGEAAFNKVCTTCHTAGVLGAPKVGDKAAWAPRIAQGKDTLYKDAIQRQGQHAAKGGTTWPDATIRMTVDYMVSLNK